MESAGFGGIYLLGHGHSKIIGSKLPSNGQVLRVLFYNLRKARLDVRSGAGTVIRQVEVFWKMARIPTKQTHNSVAKLLALYRKWRVLQRSRKRRSGLQERREKDFVDTLDDLFDIAHNDALTKIKTFEGKQFLLSQRQKGRPGSIFGAERDLIENEQLRALQQEEEDIEEPWKLEIDRKPEVAELPELWSPSFKHESDNSEFEGSFLTDEPDFLIKSEIN